MFKEEREEQQFYWDMIGDVAKGRPNLGMTTDVRVYRLMQYTLRDLLIQKFDVQTADAIFYEAGEKAGKELCQALLSGKESFSKFVVALQELLKDLGVGILRIEKSDLENLHFTISVEEDLDCSGLPVCDETICTYDEGFISGVLGSYTGKDFSVQEVDCWCTGDRVCRFEARAR